MIKFYPTYEKAVLNEDSPAWLTRYDGFIQLLPNETLCQITNEKTDIAFGENILVEILDICGEVQQDVTNHFYFEEFTDNNGIEQIRYEFGLLNVDYYGELSILKLTHTASDKVWFSNPFQITANQPELTTLFVYGKNREFFEKIRLNCFKTDINTFVENEEYTQLSGRVISLRPIITPIDKFMFWYCNAVTYKGLVDLLNSNIIYINGIRISNKPKITKGERTEDTNFFTVDFEANPTDETFDLGFQLYSQYLRLTETSPTNSSINTVLQINDITANCSQFRLYFNIPIEINNGIFAKMYKDGTFFAYNNAYTNLGTFVNFDFSNNPIVTRGQYRIEIPVNSITSNSETYDSTTLDWTFKII